MSRYSDNAPVGHTCPDINEAQSIADNVIGKIDSSIGEFNDAKKYLNSLISQLELLRKENSQLRDWGNEYYEKYEDLEKEYKYFEEDKIKEINSLQSQISGLERENIDLYDEIESLKEQRQDLRNNINSYGLL